MSKEQHLTIKLRAGYHIMGLEHEEKLTYGGTQLDVPKAVADRLVQQGCADIIGVPAEEATDVLVAAPVNRQAPVGIKR